MNFFTRRCLGLSLFLALALICVFVNYVLTTQLRDASLFSGLSLLTLLLVLTVFNARKKLPFLPLLPASVWMQIHIYVGLLSTVFFALHVNGRLMHGWLESVLAVLYLAVAGSGVLGIAITRWMPPRLTAHGEPVIYERIPALRSALQRELEEVVGKSVMQTRSSTIADFYESNLRGYFARPRHLWSHLVGNEQPRTQLVAEAEALDRFLNPAEREIMTRIMALIHAKDNLDFQLAGQRLLKLWLFMHIPLTYGLLLFAFVHAFLALTLS